MDVSPKSRETVFVCHVSQAHGQSAGWHLYSSVQTPRRPRSLNLTHSMSLPERGNLPREALENGTRCHTSKSSSTETSSHKWSEYSSRYELSPMLQQFSGLSENSLLTSPPRTTESLCRRGAPRWQNLFIPESEVNEDEEDEDLDGDNLHKYHEGSSLQLQENFFVCQSMDPGNSSECRAGTSLYSQEISNYVVKPLMKENKEHERESYRGCEDCKDHKETPITLMDCDEQDWMDEDVYSKQTLEEPDNNWVQTDNLLNSESLTQNPADYITDSSCNSSDGVLVNFSAIYNKTNNAVPATPLNLDSPVYQSGTMVQGASNPVPSWSSCNMDPNSNIYPHDSDGFSSMEITDLSVCLQSQAQLAGSTQNYYKLVSCDLSSQSSPSPPWSSLTSFSETHSQGSSPLFKYFLFQRSEKKENERQKVNQSGPKDDGHNEGKKTTRDTRNQFRGTKNKMAHAKTSHSATKVSDYKSYNYTRTPQSYSWIGSEKISTLLNLGTLQTSCPSNLDTNLSSPNSRQHATSFAEIARCKKENGDSSCMKQSTEGPSSLYSCSLSSTQKKYASDQNATSFNPKNNDIVTIHPLCTDSRNPSNPEGECSFSPDVVRYTKAQRPTSLPIQPFVLQAPSGKQQNKMLGSLLNQYISHKYTKPGPSKATCKSKERPHMQPSPLGSYSTILLEAGTSSDTCSTCTSSPALPYSHSQCTHPCTLMGCIQQTLNLMNRSPETSRNTRLRSPQSPEQTEGSPNTCSNQTHLSQKHSGRQQAFSLSVTSTYQDYPPGQMSLVQAETSPVIREELLATGPQNVSYTFQHESTPAITSVTSLTSITSLNSVPGGGQRSLCPFEAASQVCITEKFSNNICNYLGPRRALCVKKEHQHGDSFSMTARRPQEFCLSSEAHSETLSFDLLHKKSMLKAVSLAVDLIMVHFGSRHEPEDKVMLGNSSMHNGINQLVFKHLCPAIQNILQDGLKAYKLDFIIGQRPNKLWNVIEATARSDSSTRMPDSLLSVVKKCSQFTSHNMRLYVFIMGLLNLRALECWILYLSSCTDIVKGHYHPWGFLALAQGSTYGPLFQELFLLLHPLSLLSFDPYLPSETHLQSKQKQILTAPLPHKLLGQSAQVLQMKPVQKNHRSPTGHTDISSNKVTGGYWLNETPTSECESVCCSDSTYNKEVKETGMGNCMMPESSSRSQEDKSLSAPRWARLFGSVGGTSSGPKTAQKNLSGTLRRRPSEWLKIGASKVDLLAQSVWTGKLSETPLRLNHDKDTANNEHILNLY